MIKIKSNKIIYKNALFDGYLYIEGNKILEVSTLDKPCDEFYDFTNSYVSAGFIDIHTHGIGGNAYMDSSAQAVVDGANLTIAHGTTSIVPTISTGEFENMKKAVIDIDTAIKSGKSLCHILGAHLEGPYISPNQAGAQFPSYITPPVKKDYEQLVKDYGESICRWTYAPENDKGGEFCKFLTENGIIASAGHTDAKYNDMLIAVENGCNLVTHLYSCTSTITRNQGFRSLGVIESAYLLDDIYVEIIADGKHLPPELIKMVLKIKGYDKVILVTDSLEIAGTNVLEGVMSGTEFIVEDGVCKLKDRSAFAGSVATSDVLVRTLVKDCGVDILNAVKMITENPSKLLKVNKGVLESGKDADVIVFDEDIIVNSVFIDGKKVK